MNEDPGIRFIVFFVPAFIAITFGTTFYAKYIRTKWFFGFLWILLGFFCGVFNAFILAYMVERGMVAPGPNWSVRGKEFVLPMVGVWLFAIPGIIRLYKAWIQGELTEAEKSPGRVGFAAWLSPGTIFIAIGLSVSAWIALSWNPWVTLIAVVILFGLYPTMLSFQVEAKVQSSDGRRVTLSERERVMQMVESGTVSPHEGAELMSALGAAPESQTKKISKSMVMRCLGAGIVFTSLLFPWYQVNLENELGRLAGGMQNQIQEYSQQLGGHGVSNNFPEGMGQLRDVLSQDIDVFASDIKHGMAWMILLLALSLPILDGLINDLNQSIRTRLDWAFWSVGLALTTYLLVTGMRWVSFGLVLALVGYGVLFFAIRHRGFVVESD
ncbi:MAG: hypothetical protein AAFX93_10805 [Verrucomicrobiota bacterium]